jgi:hypothetical protein
VAEFLEVLSERCSAMSRGDIWCVELGLPGVPFLLLLLSWLCRLACLLLCLLCVSRSGLRRCLVHCGLLSFHLSRLAFLLRSSACDRGERVLLLVRPCFLLLRLSLLGGFDILDVLRLLVLPRLCWLVWRLSCSCRLVISEL